jgi:hypothetical protein
MGIHGKGIEFDRVHVLLYSTQESINKTSHFTNRFEDHNFLQSACSDFRIRQLRLLKQEHNAFCGFLLVREATLPG